MRPYLLAFAALITTACEVAGPGGVDADGDGVPEGLDCDDGNPNVNPYQAEICDGIDNNCDGNIDENVSIRFYPDRDGDGQGDKFSHVLACALEDGLSTNALDCDDYDPTTYSGAPELCDGIDNDCDPATAIDEGATTPYWPDADADGFGAGDRVDACEPPVGHADNNGDCDDADASVHPGAAEICDGVDQDCDGQVDEGVTSLVYADTDNDGYGDPYAPRQGCPDGPYVSLDPTDCDDTSALIWPGAPDPAGDGIDQDCDGRDGPMPPECESPPSVTAPVSLAECHAYPESFDVRALWAVRGFDVDPSSAAVHMTPVVGNLSDDNANGVIDAGDVPDIAFVTNRSDDTTNGIIRVVSGDDGRVLLDIGAVVHGDTTWHPLDFSGLALGDIDGDGEPEIVGTGTEAGGTCRVIAWSIDGGIDWVADDLIHCGNNHPALADLTGDGTVEVIVGASIIDGASGATLAVGAGAIGGDTVWLFGGGSHSFAADLDDDGTLEVIAGPSIYDPSGAVLCDVGGFDAYPAAADLDGDGVAEVVLSGQGRLRVVSYAPGACSEISWALAGGGGGPPTLADFDGDGVPEIGVASQNVYEVFEADGTRIFSLVTDDPIGAGSAIAFDLEDDADVELVFADFSSTWFLDVATSTVLAKVPGRDSNARSEGPAIADLDRDGHAELIVPASGPISGIQVFGSDQGRWGSARPVYNQSAFDPLRVGDDLSLATTADPPWSGHNSMRQAHREVGAFATAPNVYLQAPDWGVCQSACGGPVTFYVQVGNDGAHPTPAALELALLGRRTDGAVVEVARKAIGSPVRPATLSAPLSFVISSAQAAAYDHLEIAIDPDDLLAECSEADNLVIAAPFQVCE